MKFTYRQLEIMHLLSRNMVDDRIPMTIRYLDSGEDVAHVAHVNEISIAEAMHLIITGELSERGYYIKSLGKYSKSDIMTAR